MTVIATPTPSSVERPGEIGGETLARLQAMIAETLLAPADFARWFGRYTTQPRNADVDWRPEMPIASEDTRKLLCAGTALIRNPAVRFAFVRPSAETLNLFVDGERISCPDEVGDFAMLCCAHSRIAPNPEMATSPLVLALVVELVNLGALAFEADA